MIFTESGLVVSGYGFFLFLLVSLGIVSEAVEYSSYTFVVEATLFSATTEVPKIAIPITVAAKSFFIIFDFTCFRYHSR